MIAAALVQTAVLLSSGAFNVLLNPDSLNVGTQLFVSSVILMIGFAQGMVLLLLKVLIRSVTGWNPRFGTSYLFAPLASAMSNSINDRPGEIEVNTPVVTPVFTRHHTTEPREAKGSVYDGYDSDDCDEDVTASHFMPELELAIDERRNVYTDIYLLGIATFTTTYCIDTVSPTPTAAFVSGLLIMSVSQSINILIILMRTSGQHMDPEMFREMRSKRLLTVTSCIFATGSFVMFCVAMGTTEAIQTPIHSIFDMTFSILLPLTAPWLLVTVSPKQQPLRTFFECTPFVFTICFSYVLFFLATRGQLSTIVHEMASSVAKADNATNVTMSNNIVDIEFHSNVNASIRFNMEMFSKTSVDSAGNIPMLLLAPLVKIPTIVVVLANVVNRSNLVVITVLLVVLSLREVLDSEMTDLPTHRAYTVALLLAVVSLVFNVVKYLKMPRCIVHLNDGNSAHSSQVDIDASLPLEEL